MRALTVRLCQDGFCVPELHSLEAAHTTDGSLFERNRANLRAISELVLNRKEAIGKFKSDKPGIVDAGFIFEKAGFLYQHISKSKIISYIRTNSCFIDDIDWSALVEADDSITLDTAIVEQIHPFDNGSFWKYASNRINNISLEFISNYVDKINFIHDELDKSDPQNEGLTLSSRQGLSLSSNLNLTWNKDIINKFLTRWDWTILAHNRAIPWSSELISEFDLKMDFKALSYREDLEWTNDLIDKYESRWDWEALSSNSGLPWDYAFIKKFETRWIWKPKSYGYISYPFICRNELRSNSISNNGGIRWTEEFIEFIDKIDIWVIAANAYLSPFFISHVRNSLDERRLTHHIWERNSDWPSEKIETFTSGWDFIRENNYT